MGEETIMPKEGFKSITISNDYFAKLVCITLEKNITIPQWLEEHIDDDYEK